MMITSHGSCYLSGPESGALTYPLTVKTYKPKFPFLQWFDPAYIYSKVEDSGEDGSSETQMGATYYVDEIRVVKTTAQSEVFDYFAHIFVVIPDLADKTKGSKGAEVGWALAARKYTFELPKDLTVTVADKELAEAIGSDADRQAVEENETTPNYKSIYTFFCAYPYKLKGTGQEQVPVWTPITEDGLVPFQELLVKKLALIDGLIAAGAKLTDKDLAKAKKDAARASKYKSKSKGKDKTAATKGGGTGGGMGLLAIVGIAAAAYLYSKKG